MKPGQIEPIYDEKALLIEGSLVIADLHLGIEYELEKSGIKIPLQAEAMTERIASLLNKSGARHLIILGDLKHNIPQISWHEYSQIPAMIKTLSELAEITVIKGNHDGNLESLIPEIPVKKSMRIGSTILLHGHMKLPKNEEYTTIVAGHSHPCVEFRDKFKSTKESAWIRARLKKDPENEGETKEKEVIVMPAFSSLIYGTPVNSNKRLLGPIFGRMDIKNADAYLLDGTHLKIKDILPDVNTKGSKEEDTFFYTKKIR